MRNRRSLIARAFFAGRSRLNVGKLLQNLVVVTIVVASLPGQTTGGRDTPVTAVAGESWLSHLHRTFDETSMGKTDRLGSSAVVPGEVSSGQLGLAPGPGTQTVTLQDSDLYRMNCRGCHGESGLGAPPEIGSVIGPVQATSITLIRERVKRVGGDMTRKDAAELARQSQINLLRRLHDGGQDMPPFPHLNDGEIRSLVAYLKQLAGVPGAAEAQTPVRESPVRVGEQIVKSTCHVCHSAAGENPTPQQLLEGAIPPLSSLTARTNRAEFIRKVTRGAPIAMGTPPMLYRGRMPVFYYLSEEEAADVYQYLTLYPPYEWATLDPATGTLPPAPLEATATYTSAKAAFTSDNERGGFPSPGKDAGTEIVALRLVVGLLASLLLAAGMGFTVYEFRRLAAAEAVPSRVVSDLSIGDAAAESERVRRSLVA